MRRRACPSRRSAQGGGDSETPKAEREIFVPDGLAPAEALARTTHLAVGAHQDDIEIMAYHGILECFAQRGPLVHCGHHDERRGSSAGPASTRDFTDEEMQKVRREEQRKAAVVGEYAAVALLDYPSAAGEGASRARRRRRPQGRPGRRAADGRLHAQPRRQARHPRRHRAAADPGPPRGRARSPVRGSCSAARCGATWTGWSTTDKVALDVSGHENLAAALVGVFDSQIAGGKRYDLATLGRRRAHATYHESARRRRDDGPDLRHGPDAAAGRPGLDPVAYAQGYVDRFTKDVRDRLTQARGP